MAIDEPWRRTADEHGRGSGLSRAGATLLGGILNCTARPRPMIGRHGAGARVLPANAGGRGGGGSSYARGAAGRKAAPIRVAAAVRVGRGARSQRSNETLEKVARALGLAVNVSLEEYGRISILAVLAAIAKYARGAHELGRRASLRSLSGPLIPGSHTGRVFMRRRLL